MILLCSYHWWFESSTQYLFWLINLFTQFWFANFGRVTATAKHQYYCRPIRVPSPTKDRHHHWGLCFLLLYDPIQIGWRRWGQWLNAQCSVLTRISHIGVHRTHGEGEKRVIIFSYSLLNVSQVWVLDNDGCFLKTP